MCYTLKINGNIDANHANYGFATIWQVCLFRTKRTESLVSDKYDVRYL